MPFGASRFGLLGGVTAAQPALNLIQHQTASSVTSVDFTSIQGSSYDYHYLTWTDIDTGIRDNSNYWNMRLKVGGTNQSSGYSNVGQAATWGSNSGQVK